MGEIRWFVCSSRWFSVTRSILEEKSNNFFTVSHFYTLLLQACQIPPLRNTIFPRFFTMEKLLFSKVWKFSQISSKHEYVCSNVRTRLKEIEACIINGLFFVQNFLERKIFRFFFTCNFLENVPFRGTKRIRILNEIVATFSQLLLSTS